MFSSLQLGVGAAESYRKTALAKYTKPSDCRKLWLFELPPRYTRLPVDCVVSCSPFNWDVGSSSVGTSLLAPEHHRKSHFLLFSGAMFRKPRRVYRGLRKDESDEELDEKATNPSPPRPKPTTLPAPVSSKSTLSFEDDIEGGQSPPMCVIF